MHRGPTQPPAGPSSFRTDRGKGRGGGETSLSGLTLPRGGEERVAPALGKRHLARRIFMHAAHMLWSSPGPNGALKPRFSLIRAGLCRTLNADFWERPLQHQLG